MTIEHILVPLTVVCAVGSGIVGGVFFAFSTFVMGGIRKLSPSAATSAMQAINRAAPADGWFMLALMGTALVSVGLIVCTLVGLPDPAAGYRIAGAVLYLVTIVVTATYHIPRNNALLSVDPDGADVAGVWSTFASSWTAGNHVRTLSSIAAAVLLILAVRWG